MSSTDKKNTKSQTVPVDAEVVLAEREKDLNAFMQRRQQIDTLIKMMAKVTESITGWCDSALICSLNAVLTIMLLYGFLL